MKAAPVRRTLLASLLVAASVAFVLGLGAQPATACSCPALPAPAEAVEEADAVFAGRVVSEQLVERYPGEPGAPRTAAVTFHVDELWKGPVEPRLVVRTHAQESACGYAFERARSHLVYARLDAGQLTTSLCDRSTPLDQAGQDLAALGPGQDPGRVGPMMFARDRPFTTAGTILVVVVAARLLVGALRWWQLGAGNRPADSGS
jgi:hypothetical protein